MGLLHYLSYAAVLAAFAFVTLSLASGLLYVSELIEEHSRLAKTVGQRAIYAIIVLHVLLFFFDSLPFLPTLFSIACHIVYLQNFSSTWPLVSLTSVTFIASCVLVIVDHFLWFFHFAHISQEARHIRTYRGAPVPSAPGFAEIATFFGICVWLAPLFLFLSLSANDHALPVSATEPGSPISSMHPPQTRVSLFRSIFSVFSFESVPRMRSRLSRKDSSEGIIAPRTPNPPRSPLPPASPSFTPSFTPSRYNTLSPMRSPGPGANLHDFDSHLSPNSSFNLSTPPRRSQLVRKPTGEAIGLGLRRTSSSTIASDNVFNEG